MKFDYVARIRVAIGLVILFALISNLRLLRDWVQFDLSFVGHDEITTYQKRFDSIRPMLPEHGIVGYTEGGLNHGHYELSDAGALRNWFVAQYTLAPVVVSITPIHELTIMNGNPDSADNSSSEKGGSVGGSTRDIGNGIKLYDFGNGLKLVRHEF